MNPKVIAALQYILDRMKERGTWLSLGTALTGMGVAIKPDQWQLIMAIGMGIPGIVTAFIPPYVQEKNVIPAKPAEATTPLAQSLADKVVSGQTDTTQAQEKKDV